VALPGGITTIMVTGLYEDASGSPLGGAVVFTPSTDLTDAGGSVVIGSTGITAPVSSSTGVMTAQVLACTNNAGLYPLGWSYTVTVAVPGAIQTFSTLLPSTLGASTDMSALTPVSGVLSLLGKLFIPDVVSAPGTTSGGGWLYCQAGALYWTGQNGTVTKIAGA
jgi:hypothetical protein